MIRIAKKVKPKVIDTPEATIVVHNDTDNEVEKYLQEKAQEIEANEEQAFWNKFTPDGKRPKRKVGTVEEEMAAGSQIAWDMIRLEITKLNHHERIAYATLKDCPLFGDFVRDIIRSKRNDKGWLEKKLFRYFDVHMRAFTNVYHNKKIQKALNKMGFGASSGDNW